jgi:hypothetical protein
MVKVVEKQSKMTNAGVCKKVLRDLRLIREEDMKYPISFFGNVEAIRKRAFEDSSGSGIDSSSQDDENEMSTMLQSIIRK